MDEPWKHVKWKKPDILLLPFTWNVHISKSTETENSLVIATDLGMGGWTANVSGGWVGVTANVSEVSFCGNVNVLEFMVMETQSEYTKN